MSDLDTPAIGRKIAYLTEHDRAALIAILRGTLPSCWSDLASAYLSALGETNQTTVTSVLYVWNQLVKEANNDAQES